MQFIVAGNNTHLGEDCQKTVEIKNYSILFTILGDELVQNNCNSFT